MLTPHENVQSQLQTDGISARPVPLPLTYDRTTAVRPTPEQQWILQALQRRGLGSDLLKRILEKLRKDGMGRWRMDGGWMADGWRGGPRRCRSIWCWSGSCGSSIQAIMTLVGDSRSDIWLDFTGSLALDSADSVPSALRFGKRCSSAVHL